MENKSFSCFVASSRKIAARLLHIGTFRCQRWNDSYCAALLRINLPATHRWCLRRHTTQTGGRPQPLSSRSCCSGRKEARRRRSSWPASDTHKTGNTAAQTVNIWCENCVCVISSSFVVKTFKDLSWLVPSCGLTGSTPGRRKAWQKLMGLDDSARGSLGCWIDWRWLLYTSTSSSSSLIRGRWLSVSVSTGPSTVSDSMLKPDPQKVKEFRQSNT